MKSSKHWTDEYREMIDDCQSRADRMSEWESGFMDSIEEQLHDTKSLSPKQVDILNRVWEKVTEKG
jgi:hypothetical protein